ncbi:MAG: acetylxylan esterase [Chthonomonadales bacterium]|nr:acetylxylan esterase [Chthonomonadales bacterium]
MQWIAFAALAALPVAVCASAAGQPPAPARALRFAAASKGDALAWQRACRRKLFETMMGGSQPRRVPLAPQTLRRVEVPAGGYALEEVTIQTLPDRRAHLWLAVPLSPRRRGPAVLALHGHGGTGEQIVRGQGLYWYGRALAEMGYVVAAPDIGSHDLQHPGWSLMGERVWDALRVVDYLASRPEVDAGRMAVGGLSLGGETTMYVAALDERLKAADSSGWLTTVANMRNGHCTCYDFPGLAPNFDFSDIFGCIAPRPLICEIGERERAPGGFPVGVAREAWSGVQAAYRAFGAEDRASLAIHPGGHVFVGTAFWRPLRAAIGTPTPWAPEAGSPTAEALRRGEIARRAFCRARALLDGWWAYRDPATDMTPRTLDQPVWAPNDNAADMFPFLFMTARYLRPEREPDLLRLLETERRITNRVGALPDWLDLNTKRWVHAEPDTRRLVFNAAEYCKDGLLPMTESLGQGPWTVRMVEMLDDIFEAAPVQSEFGSLPADDTEVNGDLLQALTRMHAMTREPRYLKWAERIADAYFLEVLPRSGGLPARRWDFARHAPIDTALSLNDHGNEIVGGLSEAYVAATTFDPPAAARYRAPFIAMLRRLLEVARNPDGLWVGAVRTTTGEVTVRATPDTWGYALTAVATGAMVTRDRTIEDAVLRALRAIDKPAYLEWNGADSYADSIEGGLLLLNRYPEPAVARWLDAILPVFLGKQQDSGVVEGWYGDGNYARTALMAAFYFTRGATCHPWRDDLRFGAVTEGKGVRLALRADRAWEGRVRFDTPRHRLHMRLPLNYPRLNEFPEWFTADPDATYRVRVDGGAWRTVGGAELARGLALTASPGATCEVEVQPAA